MFISKQVLYRAEMALRFSCRCILLACQILSKSKSQLLWLLFVDPAVNLVEGQGINFTNIDAQLLCTYFEALFWLMAIQIVFISASWKDLGDEIEVAASTPCTGSQLSSKCWYDRPQDTVYMRSILFSIEKQKNQKAKIHFRRQKDQAEGKRKKVEKSPCHIFWHIAPTKSLTLFKSLSLSFSSLSLSLPLSLFSLSPCFKFCNAFQIDYVLENIGQSYQAYQTANVVVEQ